MRFSTFCILFAAIGLKVLSGTGPVFAQVSGTKTIGIDYPSLVAAVSDLNTSGIGAGGVTINVPANYTETIAARLILTATGTSSDPIVFQKSGSGANPVITAYTGGTGTPQTAAPDGIVVISGGDYITFDGIDLAENASNTTNPSTMEFGYGLFKASATDGCQNVTIKNCTITLNRVNNATSTSPMVEGSVGILVINSTATAATTAITPTVATGTNSNNKFYTNTIQNCNYGIALSGYAAATPFTLGDTGNDIGGSSAGQGNTIKNYGGGGTTSPAAGIRANNQWSVNISYNTINNNDGGGVNHPSTLRGIYAQAGTSANATITYNTVTVKGGGTTSQVACIENAIGSTAAGNTVNINNNTVTGDYLTATSGVFYGIYSTATAATVNIKNNTVSNIAYSTNSLTGSGALYVIYNSGAATTVDIQNNTVSNITRFGTSGGTTIGVYASSGSTQIVKFNTVSNMSIDGTGSTSTMYGIQTTTGTVVVENNIVNGLSCIKSSGTSAMYGIYNLASPTNENYNNNQVYNFSHAGTGTVYGIYANTTTGTRMVSGNQVYNIVGAGTTVAGMLMTSSSPTIAKNRIYDIRSTSTGAPTVSGLIISSLGTSGVASVYNNFISDLRAPAASATDAVRGISVTTTTSSSSINVYYNTVYLNASSTGTNFGSTGLYHTTSATATTAALDMRNNVIINLSTAAGTGLTAAYRRSSSTLTNFANTSNYNCLYAGTPSATNLIFHDGAAGYQTITAYKAIVSPREANSFSENPPFLNVSTTPYDLHLSASIQTQCESSGQRITSPAITDDFDGNTRWGETGYTGSGSTVDVGADEFEGIPMPAMTYTSSTTTQNTRPIFPNTTNNDIVGIQVVVAGISSPLVVTGFNLSTNGTTVPGDITSAKVYYTGTTGTFSTGTTFGTTATPSGSFSVTGTQQLATGTNYFWVAYDVVASPTGPNFDAECSSITFSTTPPGSPAPSVTAPAGYRVLQGPLSGTKTVGTGGDFLNLAEILAGVNGVGLGGNLTLNVISDLTESQTAAINQWVESGGSGYTLTIQPSGGAWTIQATTTTSVIKLNGADRVTIDGLNSGGNSLAIVQNSTASNTAAVWISSLGTGSGATDNTIRNCTIAAGATQNTGTTLTYGIIASGASISTTSYGADNDNNTYQGNFIKRARYGIFSIGESGTNPNANTIVTQNTIGPAAFGADQIGIGGIDLANETGASVTRNEVRFVGGDYANTTGGADRVGIAFAPSATWPPSSTLVTNSIIARNFVHDIVDERTYSAIGILLSGADGSNNTSNKVVNNVIYGVKANGTASDQAVGIGIGAGKADIVAYNSVYMYGDVDPHPSATTVSVSPFGMSVHSTGVSDLTLKDNTVYMDLFSSSAPSLSMAAINIPASYAWGAGASDYNNFYRLVSNAQTRVGCVGGSGGTFFADIASWRTATSQDANSLSADPQYNSTSNLKPYATSPLVGNATPIGGVTDDIEGNTRSTSAPPSGPTIGAYEGTADATPPVITYTPMTNGTATSTRTFASVAIADPSGVNTAAGTRPRVYYKKGGSSSQNLLGGTNDNSTPGWKWVEANGTTSPFDFTIDYTRLPGGSVSAGDTIQYFVVAQDLAGTPNVALNAGTPASTPATVALSGGAFPLSGTINQYFIGQSFTGSYTVGATGTFANLTEVANALGIGTVSGNTTFLLQSDYNGATGETFPIIFTQFDESGGPWTVTIRPANGVTGRVTSNGATAPSTALIWLNGVDRLTLDGQGRDGSGNPTGVKVWTIRAMTNTNNVPDFLFQNDATSNTLTYLIIEGNAVSTGASGTIWFSTTSGTTGNDYNTVSYCDIRDRSDAAGVPTTAVYSLGTTTTATLNNSDNTVDHCNIYNYFNPANESNAFKLSGGTTSWTITNNSIYQQNALTATTGATHYAFNINNSSSAVNYTITGNSIGGSAPNCGGGPWTASGSTIAFDGGYMNLSSGTASTMSNNTYANFAWTSASTTTSAPGIWTAMWIVAGNCTVTGNTIGAATGTGSITVTTSGSGGSISYMLHSSSSGTVTISNNTIGSVTTTGSTTSTSHSLVGINATAGTPTITGNLLGSLTTANSLNAGTASTSATGQQIAGILSSGSGTTLISNNTVANLNNAYAGSGTTSWSGATRGIATSSGINTITGNTVRDLSTTSLHIGTGAANAQLIGISDYATTSGVQTISQNTVYNLQNINASAAGIYTAGIQFGGSSTNAHLIERNLVYNISVTTSSTAAQVYGILINGGTGTYRNNMIRVGVAVSNPNIVAGISKESATNNAFYFNSVYVGGSGIGTGAGEPSTYAFRRTSSATDDIRNNVFFNARSNSGSGTGKHYALYLNALTTVTSDYNVLYSTGSGAVLGFDGTADRADLSAWRSNTPFDLHSSSADPQFIAPAAATPNLHISTSAPTPVESNAVPIAGLTNDYDNDTRNATTPDVGADEGSFTGSDLVPPTISYTSFATGAVPKVLTATITDATGIPTSGAGLPVLYWKLSTSGSYSSATAVSLGGGQYQFTFGAGASITDVIQWYIVAQDMVGTPNIIASPAAGAAGYSASPPACSTPPTTPNSFTVIASISGTIHVGTAQSSPFNTLTGAITTLNASDVTSPVIFILDDATYTTPAETFPITISANASITATNTVTIKPNASTIVSVTGSTTTPLIDFNAVNNVTIDGSNAGTSSRDLTIENTNSDGAAIRFINGASSNTVKNAKLKGIGISTASPVVWFSTTTAATGCSNNTVQNCLVSGGTTASAYGFCFLGTNGKNGSGNIITQCDVTDFSSAGIYFSNYYAGSTISRNNIFETTTQSTPVTGIYLDYVPGTTLIERNRIHDLQTTATSTTIRGLYLANSSSGDVLNAINNLIYLDASSTVVDATIYGIDNFSNSGVTFNAFNNTVYIGGSSVSAGNSAGIYHHYSSTMNIGNNAVFNARSNGTGAGKHYAVWASTSSYFTSLSSDYNNLYVSGTGGHIGYDGSADRTTFSSWRANTLRDLYSVNSDPAFTSTTNLQPDVTNPNCWSLNGNAMPNALVANDYNGNTRSTTVAGGATDIGAYEFTPTATPPSATPSASPANSTTTTYSLFGRTLCSIDWGAGGTVPSAIDVKHYSGVNPPGPLQGGYANSYMTVTATGGSGYSYDITFPYTPAILGTITGESSIRLAKRDAGVWITFVSPPNTLSKTVTQSGLTSFSDFTLTDASNPLPVELTAFNAVLRGSVVDLTWKTASEFNSLYFAVERQTAGGAGWREIARVNAQGVKDSPTEYTATDDRLPAAGDLIYRLRMVDRDGSYRYSHEVRVSRLKVEGFRLFANYPNPFHPLTTISFGLPQEQFVTVKVYDPAGREVETLLSRTMPAGMHAVTFFAKDYPSGVYRYLVIAGGQQRAGKMVLVR